MAVLKVEEMHCEKCVERISKALSAADLEFEVSLADKRVTINGCEHCVKMAVSELDDLGFTAVEVTE